MSTLFQLYRKVNDSKAWCFNVASSRPLKKEEGHALRLILADGLLAETVQLQPVLTGERVVEVGPRMNFATAWSSNMVSICHAAGLKSIIRVERSRRLVVPQGEDVEPFVARSHDRMTECLYPQPLTTFETGVKPEAVYEVPLKEEGLAAFDALPGISMDEWDRNLYYDYFVKKNDRNPTIVELMDLNNANSEHSRHGFFRGRQVIDGEEKSATLFDLVKETLVASPKGSRIAFKDNSSAIAGCEVEVLRPGRPGHPSAFQLETVEMDPLLTAETHNFPTGVAPFPGAETGSGGRIRDVLGTGQGAFVMAGTAGYCVGSLHIPGYKMAWEQDYPCPDTLAGALEIEISASNGASDYGNKFGEPLIGGFTRSFDMRVGDERWAFLKPIMFTSGIGQIDERHIKKAAEEKGMIIIQVGGPAYRVGFGGGAASSMMQGENESSLDFNAVQRGDAEMEQKMSRVVRACIEMGAHNIVDVIHDQGAGGPANVLKELVEHSGGRVEIRNIHVGDPTMSVLEIYVAEYQERTGFLIRPEKVQQFEAICIREKVGCEILGEVTGDLRFLVHDANDNTTPVDIDIPALLGEMPQKTFSDNRRSLAATPLQLPQVSVDEALGRVLRLVSVGSKRFLTNKVDRAVTGLVAQQQCCGPLQLTVGNTQVLAQSHFSLSGIASSIGEQSIKMLVNPAAGARMAVGESLTNLVWARIADMEQIKCSANWMWAPKLPGEGAALYDACEAMSTLMKEVGVAVDGGKDSLSMATMVENEMVKSPRELVISNYAAMPDVRCKVTPDIKQLGSALLFVDLGEGKNRLGGSALAQVYGQVGDESPDVEKGSLLKNAFLAVQSCIKEELLSAGHDRSDGGLITTLLEMAFAGNCGLEVELAHEGSSLSALFGEELGLVLECREENCLAVEKIFREAGVPLLKIGDTKAEQQIVVRCNGEVVLDRAMPELREMWEETSWQLERLQMNAEYADEERHNIRDRRGPQYHLPYTPDVSDPALLQTAEKPKVAILRDEGSNSEREMAAAFTLAGFEAWDICMNDLLSGAIDLSQFRGLAAVGGFSYADVPESAKGWAATILFNDTMREMFTAFYERSDTFTLGICNGCQLFGLLGWVPQAGLPAERQPRFIHNLSGRFESRWATVKVQNSRAMMLQGMEGLTFGIHVDHGEGLLHFPDTTILDMVKTGGQTPMVFVDDSGVATEAYPFNPNGSVEGLAGLCSADGRHLALMPHPERCFLPWQCHYLPEEMKELEVSPWLRMFQNARKWCDDVR
ncbi:phosphoribosylformylglycinamidine synthase [Desulforhopalus vacuolatus]|nr:phosphoribosylformylglycinamidine synthase [Desulforhopalus vacuolatus]